MLSTLIMVLLALLQGDTVPPKPLLLLNGTAHLGEGVIIPHAALAIAGDSISLLGDARVLRIDKSYYRIANVYGQHIYPARLIAASAAASRAAEGHPSVPIGEDQMLIPRLLTQKDHALRLGAPATLLVTDTPMSHETPPQVQRAFVAGQEVALPDSPAQTCRP